ncbi:hypothetical protein [Mariniflexile sp. AS56]|uniref:hypothetical protein n=1 Tax=Mariniflexile sp. AS56 TaxID=3063957 RepID=UPI0026EF061A|nr:hypothetical protein [Mariniflexile sp. AS56]MDO7171361.1 hypothetical protein [Mariniflexile sp. AS56]
MVKFLKKLSIYGTICFIIITLVLIIFGGNIDYFYEKFTTPKTNSMIIGDSRALQGIQPNVLNKRLKSLDIDLPILNYSFTIAQAHIGPLYRKSILKKIEGKSKNGLFIVSLTPMMIASHHSKNNEKGEFIEANTPPHNMLNVTMNPNYEYLLRNINYFHFKALFRKSSTMHKNGWLEAHNLPTNTNTLKEWKNLQLEMMEGFERDYEISEYRKKSLDSLIKDLKKNGKVVLIRMPIEKEILDLENIFYPEFDDFISETAHTNNIKYYNFTKSDAIKMNFTTYDGHHLNKEGGIQFTNALSDSISSIINKNN